jgi:hypothetical protein
MSNEADKARFWTLAKRYNELGQLLPKRPVVDAGARAIIAEMNKTKSEIDAIIDRNSTK